MNPDHGVVPGPVAARHFGDPAAHGQQQADVEHVAEHRGDHAQKPALARINPGQRHGGETHDRHRQHQRPAPRQFRHGLIATVVDQIQGGTAPDLRRAAAGTLAADAHAGFFEGHFAVIRLAGLTLVLVAVGQFQVADAVLLHQVAAARPDRKQAAGCLTGEAGVGHEHVFQYAFLTVEAFRVGGPLVVVVAFDVEAPGGQQFQHRAPFLFLEDAVYLRVPLRGHVEREQGDHAHRHQGGYNQ